MRGEIEHLSVGANLVPHTHCLTAACLSLLGGSQEMPTSFEDNLEYLNTQSP